MEVAVLCIFHTFTSVKQGLLLIFLFLTTCNCFAQKQDYVWCFGDSAGIDFNSVPPVAINSSLRTLGGTASISDKEGKLLFYIDASYNLGPLGACYPFCGVIYNKNHTKMLNSDSILAVGSAFQNFLILPIPEDSNNYYIFYITVISGTSYGPQPLLCSKINLSLDGNLGGVEDKNIPLITDTLSPGKLAATRHANGRDWWILAHDTYNTFYKFLVTPSGIQGPVKQQIGSSPTLRGQMVFSNAGENLVLVGTDWAIVDVFDFDRCTGEISNWRDIGEHYHSSDSVGYSYWGCAFSGNGKVLYVSTVSYPHNDWSGLKLYQYDLTATNIKASKKTIWSYTDSVWIELEELMLAPDNRIYAASFYHDLNSFNYPYYSNSSFNHYNQNLSVINNPDNIGAACDFQPFSFYLGGKRSYVGLPNMPNYNLGCVRGSVCDSLACTTGIEKMKAFVQFQLFPNPNNGSFELNFSSPLMENSDLKIYNILGDVVNIYPLSKSISRFEVKEPLPPGTYFYRIESNITLWTMGKFVVLR